MPDTVLVIPCYNEAERLVADRFRTFAAGAPEVHLLFVNDGSTDGTADVLETLCRDTPAFDVMHQDRNRGKAEAVRRGILAALEPADGSAPGFVGFWDADLATPLEEFPALRAVFDERPGLEMVFGSRVNLLGRAIRRKLARHYIGRVFATAVATMLRLPIYDTQCGAKLFRVDDGLVELFREPFLSRWVFDVEIIARSVAARRGTDRPAVRDIIYEQPLMSWYDVAGSKLRLRDFAIVAGDLMRIYRHYVRPSR